MNTTDIETLVLGPIRALSLRLTDVERRVSLAEASGPAVEAGSDIKTRFIDLITSAGSSFEMALEAKGNHKNIRNMACRRLSAEGWGTARIAHLITRDKRTLRNVLQRKGQRNHGDLVKEAIANRKKK